MAHIGVADAVCGLDIDGLARHCRSSPLMFAGNRDLREISAAMSKMC
jgi:hypothetical protein